MMISTPTDVLMIVGPETTETFREFDDEPWETYPAVTLHFWIAAESEPYVSIVFTFEKQEDGCRYRSLGGLEAHHEEIVDRIMAAGDVVNPPPQRDVHSMIADMVQEAMDLLEAGQLNPGLRKLWSGRNIHGKKD